MVPAAAPPPAEQDASSELRPPRRFGPYTLVRRLGHGGGATVFVAVEERPPADGSAASRRVLVVKRLHEHLNEDPPSRARFLREASLLARLDHPAIVRTLDAGEANQRAYIAMEHLVGRDLACVMTALEAQGRRMPVEMAVRIAMQALQGLHHAHEAIDDDGTPLGIVHRDVTPQNLYITYDGQVKLLDFGIAKVAAGAVRTSTGIVRGKLGYIAPEQARAGHVDRRADLFSLGVVLWELLAGTELFKSDGDFAALTGSFAGALPPLREVRPETPPQLAAIVERALQREPDARYASALAMHDALAAWAEAHPCSSAELGALLRELCGEAVVEEDRAYSETLIARSLLPPAEPPERPLAPHRALWLGLAAAALATLMWLEAPASPPPQPALSPSHTAAQLPVPVPVPAPVPAPVPEAAPVPVPVPAPVPEAEAAPAPKHTPTRAHPKPSNADAARPTPTRARPQPAAPGKLTLVSDPWSVVSLGTRPLGTTPLIGVPLSAGEHELTLHNPTTGETRKVRVEVRSGETTTRRIKLATGQAAVDPGAP